MLLLRLASQNTQYVIIVKKVCFRFLFVIKITFADLPKMIWKGFGLFFV